MCLSSLYKTLIKAVLLLALTAAMPARAAAPIAECTVDGAHFKKIFDVHETADGRIAILYHVGGITTDRSNLTKDFLDSWGLGTPSAPKPAGDQPGADWFRASQIQELDALLNAGLIRRVGQYVYNLRKEPAGWETLANAKVIAMTKAGSVLEVPDRPTDARFVYVEHLPMVQNGGDTVTAQAKLLGFQKRTVKGYGELTISAYDYGIICTKDDVSFDSLNAGVNGSATSAWSAGQSHGKDTAETDPARRSGSGFFVSADGLFLTSYHVVTGATRLTIKRNGKKFPAAVKTFDAKNDLALLKVEGRDFKYLSLAASANAGLGQSVFTIGYPNPSLQGVEPKYSEGSISGLDGYRDDPREYQMSVPVQPGNSGGPLCNGKGEVIGIVRAELTANLALMHSGALPQNVNYAVKSKYAADLLQSDDSGKSLPPGNNSTGADSPEAVREHTMNAVAMVLVY